MSNTLENIKTDLFTEKGAEAMCYDNTDFSKWWSDAIVNQIAESYAHSQTQELLEMVKYLYNFSKGRHFHTGSVTDRTVTELINKYQQP